MSHGANSATRLILRELALGCIAARPQGMAAGARLHELRSIITPEIVIALLDSASETASEIARRIELHAESVDDALTIARGVMREKAGTL